MKYKIDQFNYQSLPHLAEILRQDKAEKIELEITKQVEDLPFFPDIIPFLYQLMNYESYFQVEIKDFPFCLIELDAGDEIKLATADIGGTGTGNYYSASLNLVKIGDKL